MQIPPVEWTAEEAAYLRDLEKRTTYDPNRMCPYCEAPVGEHRFGGVNGTGHHPAPIKWVPFKVGNKEVLVSPEDLEDLNNDLLLFGTISVTQDVATGRGKRIDPTRIKIEA